MSAFPFFRKLGCTDLETSCIGIGGGAGISCDDVLYACERGINFLFFSSDLHHFIYRRMVGAVRTLCGSGSSVRSQYVLAAVTYIKQPDLLESILFDQFTELGVDYIDLFLWGWVGAESEGQLPGVIKSVPWLRGPSSGFQKWIEHVYGVSEQVRSLGAVRYVGMSFHDTKLAGRVANESDLDVVMVRHNFVHRSAQHRVLIPLADRGNGRPGVICFNSTHGLHGMLWQPPYSPAEASHLPTPGDCYRYTLSQPTVDVCLTGPRNRKHIDTALDAVALGRLKPAEQSWLERYGDNYRDRAQKTATESRNGHTVNRSRLAGDS